MTFLLKLIRPALFNKISREIFLFKYFSDAVLISSWEDKSAIINEFWPLDILFISVNKFSAFNLFLAMNVMFAPIFASARADSLPIPEVAPVIKIFLLLTSNI